MAVDIEQTYRATLAAPMVGRIAGSMLFSRLSAQGFSIALVLFLLGEFHSAPLAGACVFMSIAPGLLVSPIAGVLLDRHDAARMVKLDYIASAAVCVALPGLAAAHLLSAGVALGVCFAASLTNALSFAGMRSALPSLLPASHWDRANAIDSVSQDVATTVGPAAAGVIAGLAGTRLSLLVVGGGWVLASILLLGVRIESRATSGSILREARTGITYLLRNPTLRGIAATLSISNASFGVIVVAAPILVFNRFHGGAPLVGLLWACSGIASVSASLLIGNRSTAGREKRMFVAGILGQTVSMVAFAVAPNAAVAVAAFAFWGGACAIMNLPVWAMRQRRTNPALFGRIVALSMSLNMSGIPIGSAVAGTFVQQHLTAAFLVAAGLTLIGAVVGMLMVPTKDGRG
jgi:predicted MFS family arabinose efflux permease